MVAFVVAAVQLLPQILTSGARLEGEERQSGQSPEYKHFGLGRRHLPVAVGTEYPAARHGHCWKGADALIL